MSNIVMQQALDALKAWNNANVTHLPVVYPQGQQAITALEAELAKSKQELNYPPECKTPDEELAYAAGWWKALEVNRKKWITLTDTEIDTLAQQEGFTPNKSPKWFTEVCYNFEAKLKEKNT